MEKTDWFEFVVNGLCGLCGNAGVVDRRGLTSAAGHPCGGLHYCVCPNGRKLKEHGAAKEVRLLPAPEDEWLRTTLHGVKVKVLLDREAG